jgi:CRP-like cAMP-binding protein
MSTPESKIAAFIKKFPTESYSPQTPILTAGTQTAYFYYVLEGAVKMVTTSPKGRNLILHTFFPKTFFSLFSLVNSGSNQYDFVTQLPTVVAKVPQHELLTFLKSDTDVLFELQLRLVKGLIGLTKRIEQSTLSSAYQQVASLLLYFAEHFSEPVDRLHPTPSSHRLVVRITHQEMSEWLGLSRENVSIQMKLLEKNDLIKMSERYVEILSTDLLKTVLNQRDTM